MARLPVLDHQGHVQVLTVQLDALGQGEAVLFGVAQVLDRPLILHQRGQPALGVESGLALAGRGWKAAYPPYKMRDGQTPANLFLQQLFGAARLVAALVGHFQADLARATGQAHSAAAQGAGQADIVIVLALQPVQGSTAGILGRANTHLAVDVPAIDLAGLRPVGSPLGAADLAFALAGVTAAETGTAGQQGNQAEHR
jgi:hypothetical protein